jgi:hypothetical protein
MRVLFVAGIAPIVPDVAAARSLYADGLPGPEGLLVGVSYAPWYHEVEGSGGGNA